MNSSSLHPYKQITYTKYVSMVLHGDDEQFQIFAKSWKFPQIAPPEGCARRCFSIHFAGGSFVFPLISRRFIHFRRRISAMECTLLETPVECHFASKGYNGQNQCSYNGSSCFPVVEECLSGDDEKACEHIMEFPKGKYCAKFPNPENRWERGRCPLATHIKLDFEAPLEKKLNPLKASKRAARGI